MNLEGKIVGYEKKTVAIVCVFVVVAGVMFYAGAKWEKNKLLSTKLLMGSPYSTTSGPKVKKSKTPAQRGVNTPNDVNNQNNPSATPSNTPQNNATSQSNIDTSNNNASQNSATNNSSDTNSQDNVNNLGN